jgi:hypothetical protein
MKNFYLLLLAVFVSSNLCLAQCTETDQVKVLLVGDSWANFIGVDQSINTNLEKWGHSNYKFFTNAILAENGTQTIDFLQPAKLNEIAAQLNAYPDLEIVHLSLGGNDVLNEWNKNWAQAKTDSLLDSVYARLVTLIDFIKITKPGIKILWSGYAYPNFGEIISEMAPFQSSHPYYSMWTAMGSPEFNELNGLLNYFSDTIMALATIDPQVDFVDATGLMQYTFGQPSNLSVPPGGNYPMLTAPLPEGFPTYPSPKNSMRTYIIFRDCFHLSPQGYDDFVDYQTKKYYQKTLMDDMYLLSDGGTHDGAVSSLGSVSTAIQIGTSGQDEFAAMLTFNTTMMPDTGVSKASIFLRRESLTGINPSTSPLQVKVVSGNFGATADVEATDYTEPGNASDIPCQFGSAADDGHWIRLELPATLLPYISHTTPTQFMIAPQLSVNGLVTFSSASDPDFAPVLNITYGPSPLAVHDPSTVNGTIRVYPNPTNGELMFSNVPGSIDEIQILDLPGKLITKFSGTEKADISMLPPGMYCIKIISGNTVSSSKIVKK